MPKDDSRNDALERLKSAEAYLEYLTEGTDSALARLGDDDSPEAVLRRLQILLESGRVPEAADTARDREPDQRWCEEAAAALALNGEQEQAQRVVEWSRNQMNLSIWHRCLIAMAEARLQRLLHERSRASSRLLPSEITPQEKRELNLVLDALAPPLTIASANERIENEVESRAVQGALHINGLLGNRRRSAQLARLLATRKPVPMMLAHASLQRWIDVPADLPQRLREEHSDSFEAKLAASVIEGSYLGKPETAFQSALQLVQRADVREQRERLFGVLLNLAQDIGEDAMQKLDELVPSLLSENPRSLSLFTAAKMLRQNRIEDAGPILNELRDENDLLWLQIYAGYLSAKGDKTAAADYLAKASSQLSNPDLLWKTALVAYDAGHIDDSIRALEQLLELIPGDTASRKNVVALYLRKRDYASASSHLKVLTEIDPSDGNYALNYANSLAFSGQAEQALSVYNALCATNDPPLTAVLDRAKLLRSMGRVPDAFDSLDKMRTRYWNNAQFLVVLLDLAFVADKEDAGGEVFNRLRELQAQGQTDRDVLISMSLDDMVDRNKEFNHQKDIANEQIVSGRIPWLAVERILGRVSYWGWFMRTQPLSWLFDDPLNRAEYSIYSTNAYAVVSGSRARQSALKEVECAPRDKAITIDLSALITLHRLGLLDKAASYFGRILFPSVFLPNALEEGSRLVLHQGSMRTFYQSIADALSREQVAVIGDAGAPGNRPMPFVNEHTLEEDEIEHYYRLRDVLHILYKNGRITEAQYQKVLSVAHNPTGVDQAHPVLRPASPVMFELSTLRTLSASGLLSPVLETFKVHITPNAKKEVYDSLSAIDAQEQVRKWHEDLWNIVRKDERFVQVAHISSVAARMEEENSTRNDMPIAAISLAIQEKVPLLADDRCCQMVVLNDRDGARNAFGTDRLIVALEKSGVISRDEAADALTTLMAWRYRFILPPAWVLKTLADRFEDNSPGRQLRNVVRYLHDCMRDVGLFTGIEKTSPPISIGLQLYHEWRRIIMEFVVDVWADSRFSEDSAERLTQWAVTEFLPSVPAAIPQAQQARIGAIDSPKMRIVSALLNIHKVRDAQRGNRALRTIADALGIDDGDYLKAVTEVIDYASK